MHSNASSISEADSLVEKVELRDKENEPLVSTRPKRPIRLQTSNSSHRKSLMSPPGFSTNSQESMTPNFVMTQSMFEPSERKKEQEKQNQESKLLNYIAKEKAAQKALERKAKELKKRALEQKKKNEERKRLADERRQKLLEFRQSSVPQKKMSQTINPATSNMTCSFYGVGRSISKKRSTSFFMSNRPISSTGKVFGFGSSTPRVACDPIRNNVKQFSHQSCYDLQKSPQDVSSRMYTSQIIGHSMTRSIMEPKNKNSTNVQQRDKVLKPKKIKTNSKLMTTSVYDSVKQKTTPTKPFDSSTFNRSRSRNAKSNNFLSVSNKKKIETDTKKSPTKITIKENKSGKTSDVVQNAKQNQKSPAKENEKISSSTKDISKDEYQQKLREQRRLARERKQKALEEKSLLETSTPNVTEITNTDKQSENVETTTYVQQNEQIESNTINNNHQLDRQQEQQKQEEQQQQKQQQDEIKNKEDKNSNVKQKEVTVTFSCTDKENDDNKPPMSNHDNIETEEDKPVPHISIITSETKETKPDSADKQKVEQASESNIELPKNDSLADLTASTEDLARVERRKKLDAIMSRIRKPSGSSENLSLDARGSNVSINSGATPGVAGSALGSSVLQTMMEKGHLTGMSKTAAILMKNAHSTERLQSNTDYQSKVNQLKIIQKDETTKSGNQEPVVREACDGKEDSPVRKESSNDLIKEETRNDGITSNNVGNTDYTVSKWNNKYVLDSMDSETETRTEEMSS